MKKYKHKQSNSIAEQTSHTTIYKVSTNLGEVTHVPSSLIECTSDWEEVKEVKQIPLREHTRKVKYVEFPYLYSFTQQSVRGNRLVQPMYTTTDGINIYQGESLKLFILEKDWTPTYSKQITIYSFNEEDKKVAEKFLTFTSEENRDKYIKENQRKPIFVSADGKEMFKGDKYYVPQISNRNELLGTYLEFITTIITIYGKTKFSSSELAKEYIDNNKPKYSLKDIESCYPSRTNSHLYTTFIANIKKLSK